MRRRVLAEAAGNPLALTELSRVATSGDTAPASELPLTERLERAFTNRLATLPDPTRTLLRMAAVNDSPALAEIIAAACALTGAEIDPADLDPAVSAMLVDVMGAEVRFRHPLMCSAIYQSMSTADQRAAHAVLAQVLPVGQEDRRIRHQAAATALPDESVAAKLAAAADRAARRGGVAAAVEALSRAAALSEDPESRTERLLRAADFAAELGQRDTVARLLDEAAKSGLSAQQQVKVAWLRGSFDEGLRQQTSNAATLTALAEEVAASGDIELAVRILWSAAQLCFWSEPGGRVRQLVLDAAEKLPLDELDPWLIAILAYVAPVERGAVVMDRARRVAPQAGDDGRTYRMLSTGALLCGAFDLSREFSAAAGTALRAQGRLGLLARVVGAEAWSAIVVGDLGAAIVACDESRRLARETTQQLMYALMSATAGKLAALRGQTSEALALAEAAEEIGLPVGARPVLATALMARGLAALGDGRFEEAYGHFRRLHDPADPAFQSALRLTSLGDLVDAAAHSGRTDEARPIVAELAKTATQTPAPVLHADLRLAHAVLAAACDVTGDTERSVWHRAEAATGPDDQTAAELEAAAELARARGGYSGQALFLSRAAELTSAPDRRAERLLAAADAHMISGDPAAAEILLDLAAANVTGPASRARALRTRAAVEMFNVRVANVPKMLLDAAAELGAQDPGTAWDLLGEAMHAALMAREPICGTTLLDVAKATATAWHDPDAPDWSADLIMEGLARRVAEGHAEAVPVLRTALARLRAAADLKGIGIPFSDLVGFATDELWDIDSRRELTDRLAALYRGQGALYTLSLTFLVAAQAEITAGRFAEADAYYAQADDFFAATGFPADGAIHRAQLLAWTGREDELHAAVPGVADLADTFGLGHPHKMALYALSVLDLGTGRYQSALDHALPVFHDDPPSAGNLVLPLIVEAGVRAGDHDAAAAALARMTERAQAAGTPWARGLLARCQALMGADEHAEARYADSVELLGQVPVALDLAHTRLLFGEWLRRRQRRAEARVQLRAAHQLFDSCGAVPFAERARAELLATGAQVRRRTAPTRNELTQQERHVAALAAGGSTNAEIASRLFVTVSTVEFHLNKVFRKLGISSRRQISSRLGAGDDAVASTPRGG